MLLQLRTAFTKPELCHKIKVQARVKVQVPLYGAKLLTFVQTMRCYVKATLDDFISVTSDVIFLDKPTGESTASEIMRERKGHLATTRLQRISTEARHHVQAATPTCQRELMVCSYFLYVLFGSPVTRLHNMACHLQVTVNNHCFIGSICVDSNSTSMVDRFWCMTFLPAQLYITFKLARV